MKHAGICVMGALSVLYIAAILFFRGNDAWELLTQISFLKTQRQPSANLQRQY